MPKIFISYRREDSAFPAAVIRKQLISDFGEGQIFFDVDSIPSGYDFRVHISRMVESCDYVIVVIGKTWLAISDESGRRLDNPADFVRLEIESALKRTIPVIPVLVDNARMPKPDQLPETLRELVYRNAECVRPEPDLGHDLERLGKRIRQQEVERQERADAPRGDAGGRQREGAHLVEKDGSQQPAAATAPVQGLPVRAAAGASCDGTNLQPRFVRIAPGMFLMGSAEGEEHANDNERPQHRVRITKPFYLGAYEVTQGEFERVLGRNPSAFSRQGDCKDRVSGQNTSRFPVEHVSWFDAIEFCNKLSQSDGRPFYYRLQQVGRNEDGSINSASVNRVGGGGYRLPTEAEWEFACRAGTTTPFHFGSVLNGRDANCNGNKPYGTPEKGLYLDRPAPVGSYDCNAFGLFDMHGNVWEWCWDVCDELYYKNAPECDPAGSPTGMYRVYRGGSWTSYAHLCRAAVRVWYSPESRRNFLGFRLALNCEE